MASNYGQKHGEERYTWTNPYLKGCVSKRVNPPKKLQK
jgi:hypothetical protein